MMTMMMISRPKLDMPIETCTDELRRRQRQQRQILNAAEMREALLAVENAVPLALPGWYRSHAALDHRRLGEDVDRCHVHSIKRRRMVDARNVSDVGCARRLRVLDHAARAIDVVEIPHTNRCVRAAGQQQLAARELQQRPCHHRLGFVLQ